MNPKHAAILVILLTLAVPDMLRTQETNDQQNPQKVAYIRLIEGEIGYQRGDDNQAQWSAAAINTPLMTGDSLYANERGRAEIQLGDGNFLRVGKQGYIGVLQSADQAFQFKVASGTATLRLQNLDRDYEIDTPSLAFSVEKPGEYRVDVGSNGDTQITLHKGRGTASVGERQEKQLSSPARLNVASGSTEFTMSKKFKRDAWDRWCKRRDSLDYARPQYIAPGVYGYEAMSGHGTWAQSPEYGPVWIPTVEAAWQPYRLGRWVWVDPFGWTWVSYESWGWAPYHYGRWAYIGGMGWAWVPGPPTVPQRFAAALVAFLSGNQGGEWVGWFPLGPGEVYQPYARREVYVARPVRQYVNYNYVTVVNRTEIYNSTTVVYNTRVVDRQVIEHTQVATNCNITPSRETLYTPAVRVTGNQVVAAPNTSQPAPRPTDQIVQRNVHVRTTAVPAVRKFDEKLAEIQTAGVVRPVNPYQPTQPIAPVNREPGNSTNGAKVVTEKPNPPGHNEPHGRAAGMPPGLLKKEIPAANPSATGSVSAPAATTNEGAARISAAPEDQPRPGYEPPTALKGRIEHNESHGRPAGIPPGLLKKDVPATKSSATGPASVPAATTDASPAQGPAAQDQSRPRFEPPAAGKEQIGRPASTPTVPEQARPKYEPPQEVERRMGQPGVPRLGGEQPKPAYPPGQLNEHRADQPQPAVPSHEQARPGYQPPQESDRRLNEPPATPAPRQESKPGFQPAQPQSAEAKEPGKHSPTPPVAVRAQQSTPTQLTNVAIPHETPKATDPAQPETHVQPDPHNSGHQLPKAVTGAQPPQQSKQVKQADPPRPTHSASKQKPTQDDGKGKN